MGKWRVHIYKNEQICVWFFCLLGLGFGPIPTLDVDLNQYENLKQQDDSNGDGSDTGYRCELNVIEHIRSLPDVRPLLIFIRDQIRHPLCNTFIRHKGSNLPPPLNNICNGNQWDQWDMHTHSHTHMHVIYYNRMG